MTWTAIFTRGIAISVLLLCAACGGGGSEYSDSLSASESLIMPVILASSSWSMAWLVTLKVMCGFFAP